MPDIAPVRSQQYDLVSLVDPDLPDPDMLEKQDKKDLSGKIDSQLQTSSPRGSEKKVDEQLPLETEETRRKHRSTETEIGFSSRHEVLGLPAFQSEEVNSLADIRAEIDRIRQHFVSRLSQRKYTDQLAILAGMFRKIEERLEEDDIRQIIDRERCNFGWRDLAGGLLGGSVGSLLSFGSESWTDHLATSSKSSGGGSWLPGAAVFGVTSRLGTWTARSIARLLSEEKLPDPLPIRSGLSHNTARFVGDMRDQYAPAVLIYSGAYFLAGMLGIFDGAYSFGTGDPEGSGRKLAERRTAMSVLAGGMTGMVSTWLKNTASRAQILALYRTDSIGRQTVDMGWTKDMVIAMQYEAELRSPRPVCCHETLMAMKNVLYTAMPSMFLAHQARKLQSDQAHSGLQAGWNGGLGMFAFLSGWTLLHAGEEALIRKCETRGWESLQAGMDIAFETQQLEFLQPDPENRDEPGPQSSSSHGHDDGEIVYQSDEKKDDKLARQVVRDHDPKLSDRRPPDIEIVYLEPKDTGGDKDRNRNRTTNAPKGKEHPSPEYSAGGGKRNYALRSPSDSDSTTPVQFTLPKLLSGYSPTPSSTDNKEDSRGRITMKNYQLGPIQEETSEEVSSLATTSRAGKLILPVRNSLSPVTPITNSDSEPR